MRETLQPQQLSQLPSELASALFGEHTPTGEPAKDNALASGHYEGGEHSYEVRL